MAEETTKTEAPAAAAAAAPGAPGADGAPAKKIKRKTKKNILNGIVHVQSTFNNTVITITTVYPGAASSLMQGFITQPIEQAVATAEGIDYMTSSSVQGTSTVSAYIRLNYDPNKALTDVMSKVNQVKYLIPKEANDPIILKSFALGGDDLPQLGQWDPSPVDMLPHDQAIVSVHARNLGNTGKREGFVSLEDCRATVSKFGVTPAGYIRRRPTFLCCKGRLPAASALP